MGATYIAVVLLDLVEGLMLNRTRRNEAGRISSWLDVEVWLFFLFRAYWWHLHQIMRTLLKQGRSSKAVSKRLSDA